MLFSLSTSYVDTSISVRENRSELYDEATATLGRIVSRKAYVIIGGIVGIDEPALSTSWTVSLALEAVSTYRTQPRLDPEAAEGGPRGERTISWITGEETRRCMNPWSRRFGRMICRGGGLIPFISSLGLYKQRYSAVTTTEAVLGGRIVDLFSSSWAET